MIGGQNLAHRERERERESNSSSESSRGLIITLVILCLIILGLITSIVIVSLNQNKKTASEIDAEQTLATAVEEKMAGYNGEISDSAQALALTETINDKLASDPNYNPKQAVEEYQKVYESSSGDLKVYVAINYAQYVYDTFNNLQQATNILTTIEGQGSDTAEANRLHALASLYEQAGNQSTADYYKQKIAQEFPDSGAPYKGENQ